MLLGLLVASCLATLGLCATAQVKYLGGITFLLNDGCPETAEQASISQYFQCIQSEKLHTQCVTDSLQAGSRLTVPVYTDVCSAICHGDSKTKNCPFNGIRLDGKGSLGSDEVKKPVVDSFLG